MVVLDCVMEGLEHAQELLVELPDRVGAGSQLLWLERQLANIISRLLAMAADIEAGCSLAEIGFCSEDEFQEMLTDLGVEIANLKGMIQTLKMVGKCL